METGMRIRVAATIVASVALLALAACGNSGGSGGSGGSGSSPATPSASSLVASANAALKAAQSVKLAGDVVEKGKPISLDLGFLRSGAVSGTIGGQIAGNSSISVRLIVARGSAYILIDKQYFEKVLRPAGAPANACATYCGKYLKGSAKQLKNFSLVGLTRQLFDSGTKFSATVTTATINGQPVYGMRDAQGDYLYVARNGTHNPVEITKKGEGKVVFSEWNSVPPISAPPAREIAKLPGQAEQPS
jgi:hypothetical protein